nr:protein YIPF1-like [Cherax quadricarinatus]
MGDNESGEPAGLMSGASSGQLHLNTIVSLWYSPLISGPFWICTTLAFTTAITGNLANYLAASPAETYIWRYEFRKVTLAASAIFAYAWLIPIAVWGLLVWRGSRAKISLLELLCIYGYSLAIFIPVSVSA